MPNNKAHRELQIEDPVLSQIARRFKPEGFIYSDLCVPVPVTLDSGKYPVFDETYWFADEVNNLVSDRAETPEIDYKWSTESYYCEDYRLKVSITDKERRQAHSALHLEQGKLQYLLTKMAMRRERRLAALLKDSGTTGGALTGGTAAATAVFTGDTATIEADVKTGKLAVYNKTGKVPNTIVLPYEVAAAVAIQADIREILKYTVNGQQIIDQGEFILPANLWGMKVLIPRGTLVQSGNPGGSKSLSDIWGDSVRLLYVDRSAAWGTPSVAYSFKANPERVDRWSENDPPVDYIRAWETVDEKVVAGDLGYEITNCL